MRLNKLLKDISYKGESDDRNILYITHDSRKVKQGTLYIAFRGSVNDGHDYIFDAINKGAVAVVANGRAPVTNKIPILQVENPRKIMSKIAANFFNNPSKELKIIGITGTNGKTTTTQIINHILNYNKLRSGSLGTLGFDTPSGMQSTNFTTPDSIELQHILHIMKNGGINYVPMEISSHAIELNRVDDINIDIAIFTNFGSDHLDFHGNRENYLNAKLKLFKQLNKNNLSLLNIDDNNSKHIKNNKDLKSKVITFGFNKNADFYASKYKIDFNSSSFILNYRNKKYPIKTHLVGKFNIYNILASIACCTHLKVDMDSIVQSIETLIKVPGRFEKFKLPNNQGYAIIDYAHCPDSYSNIFKNLKKFKEAKSIITVFGCGGDRDNAKRSHMGYIVSKYSEKIIITNDNPRYEDSNKIIDNIKSGIDDLDKCKITIIKDRYDAIMHALKIAKNEIVLILGKGIEEHQIVEGKKIPHSDINIVKKYINENKN